MNREKRIGGKGGEGKGESSLKKKERKGRGKRRTNRARGEREERGRGGGYHIKGKRIEFMGKRKGVMNGWRGGGRRG